MAKGKRTAIEPNIFRYPDGRYEALVQVAGFKPVLQRFASTMDRAHIRGWVAKTKEAMHEAREQRSRDATDFGDDTAAERRRTEGTLEGDAPGFLSQIAGRPSTKADTSHLRAWFAVVVDGVQLGTLPRSAITSNHINQAIAQWQTAPSAHAVRRVRVGGYAREAVSVASFTVSATTVREHERVGGQAAVIRSYDRRGGVIAAHQRPANSVPGYDRAAPATSGRVVETLTIRHRCRVLADLYHTLDGKRAPTPLDEAKIPKRKKRTPITVPEPVVASTLQTLARLDVKTFARFAVVNTCAQRPCQVGRARPEDVDVLGRSWMVREAKGEPAHLISLDDPQVAAWEAFIVADAWSWETDGFDTSKYGRIIHEAGWPKGITPYKARHSFAANAIRSGVSLGDLQALLGHADPKTTRIYAPFLMDRQRAVSAQVKGYLADVFKLRLVRG